MRIKSLLLTIFLILFITLPVMAQSVTKSITAENTFSNSITTRTWVDNRRMDYGVLSISVSGTFVATWFIQRSLDNGSTWKDVISYTDSQEKTVIDYVYGHLYRVGVKTGGFTSGTLTILMEN